LYSLQGPCLLGIVWLDFGQGFGMGAPCIVLHCYAEWKYDMCVCVCVILGRHGAFEAPEVHFDQVYYIGTCIFMCLMFLVPSRLAKLQHVHLEVGALKASTQAPTG
jgi:hypothetical protein